MEAHAALADDRRALYQEYGSHHGDLPGNSGGDNLHRGGSARPVELSKEERATALKAAQVMGLNVAGVDMLRSDQGPKIMEVNSSPGLEGIQSSTGINVAKLILTFLEKNAKPNKTKTKGTG